MTDDFPQGTWDGAPVFCPICGIVGTTAKLMVSVNSLLFFCENGHTFIMYDMAEITAGFGHTQDPHQAVEQTAPL